MRTGSGFGAERPPDAPGRIARPREQRPHVEFWGEAHTGYTSPPDGHRPAPPPRRISATERLVMDFFRDDEGFTTVGVALALLLSLTLVFAAASSGWVQSRSSEVQRVADATALAGQNAVAAYSTVAQTLDACVLSMGLAGLVVYGAGLVLACVPGAQAAGIKMCQTAGKILESRRSFSKSAAQGIERLESTLPLLIVANSAACVAANSREGLSYTGCALPFPTESKSDFKGLEADVDDSKMDELSQKMADTSAKIEQTQKEASDALQRGWMADCGSSPYCLRERAQTLAGLSGSSNPQYPSPAGWTFGVPLLRARSYYAARYAQERVSGSNAEALTDSACRKAFYAFALAEVQRGSYVEHADGSVQIDLPTLPRNADQTRKTSLYTDLVWPCTDEGGSRTLHAAASCPGAKGASVGLGSLAQLEAGGASLCPSCRMDVGEMGRVAAASTSIKNGFEHHWREVVEASRDYEQAKNEQVEAEAQSKELADKGTDLFKEALEALTVTRPSLCPPGAWGCVAVVGRSEGVAVPTELTAAFLSSSELPAGAAVSAAVLAPDDSTAQNNVLASFFDGLSADGSLAAGVADGVLELWGSLLVGYGSAYNSVSDAGSRFLDGVDSVLGGTVGAWLKGRLKDVMESTGLEPADMRLRKPVLVNTQDVLAKAGMNQSAKVRSLVQALPDSGTPVEFARAAGLWLVDEFGDTKVTLAELTVPGTSIKIPLTIDLSKLRDAA